MHIHTVNALHVVQAAAESLIETFPGGIDVLLSNAGVLDDYVPALET